MQQAMTQPLNGPAPKARIGKENSPRLVMLTVQQIIKDFGMFGYPIRYTGKPEDAYEQLLEELQKVVEEINKESFDKLLEILDKIGITEQLVKETIKVKENNTIAEAISALVMEQEFMKVYLKEGSQP